MGNFHESSSDIYLEDGHILVARCNDADGEPQESRLDLDYYIGNNDGSFEWGGESFSSSASDISFGLEGDYSVPVLRAFLNPYDGDPVEANVNLAECIGNDNGTLVYVPSQ
ncbi:cyanovirin-n [Fusarium heterosporum]|uniref:Cyanovirin-n n=1 Tax=Fusarium heterosporum TaxID=42747 RepID=A0A8H5TC18_FUSHE|nr:cyanovirin-n [Fusarium heterosporum]